MNGQPADTGSWASFFKGLFVGAAIGVVATVALDSKLESEVKKLEARPKRRVAAR